MISFTGIWALRSLLATERQLSATYVAAGIVAAFTGYAAGVLADRMGARPVMLFGWTIQAAIFASFAVTGTAVFVGLALIVLTTAFATLCATASQTIVTELLPADKRTSGFAVLRLGQNLGYAFGPPLGAILIVVGWPAMFSVVALIAGCAAGVVLTRMPARQARDTSPGRQVTSKEAPRSMIHDTRFLRVYLASCFAMIVYSGEAVLLPISLTQSHDISPSVWGGLAVINPVLVIFLQLRITQKVRRVALPLQVAAAVLFMGIPFLLIPLSGALTIVAIALILYTIGEIVWAPAAQSLVSECAPAGRQGAYLGAFATTLPIGQAIGPLIGLQVRAAWGDTAMWLINGAVTIGAAMIYLWQSTSNKDRTGASSVVEAEVAARVPTV
jgi:predicted MFS family arabinose efflux permease